MTPLHHAALHANTPLIQLLLDSGADTQKTNRSGQRPVELTSDAAAQALLGWDEAADGSAAKLASPTKQEAVGTTQAAQYDEEGDTPLPARPSGDAATAPEAMLADELLGELQRALGSQDEEADPKRLLMRGAPTPRPLACCDVVRSGSGFRCYLRLDGSCARRICIFEAQRARAKGLRSAHYVIRLPADARLGGTGRRARACGKVRSFASGSHASYVLYDDGCKPGATVAKGERAAASEARRQLAAVAFARAPADDSGIRAMRVLLPVVSDDEEKDALHQRLLELRPLLDTVQALDLDAKAAVPDAESLRPSPPLWNAQEGTFQLAFEGRARCDSSKNTQLLSDRFARLPTVQVGKLRKDLFNVDLAGHISLYQAFAIAIAIFDQSSPRLL